MIVKRKKLNFWERLYLPAIIGGFKVTLRHFFKKKVTMQYPEEKWVVPDGYRGAPYLVKDQGADQMRFLPALRICLPAESHPHHAARTEGAAGGRATWRRRRENSRSTCFAAFSAASARKSARRKRFSCMKDYSLTGTSREEMIYDKEKLLALGGVHHDTIRKWKQKADEAKEQGVAAVRRLRGNWHDRHFSFIFSPR